MAQYRESKSPSSDGKRLSHLAIHHGEDGGHMVEHHYHEDGMVYHKPKQYFFGHDEYGDMIDHVRKHMPPPKGTEASPDVEREEEEV